MNALVYHGPGQRSWEEVPDPAIQQATDAIVRIGASTICGTDLHILGGDVSGLGGRSRTWASTATPLRSTSRSSGSEM